MMHYSIKCTVEEEKSCFNYIFGRIKGQILQFSDVLESVKGQNNQLLNYLMHISVGGDVQSTDGALNWQTHMPLSVVGPSEYLSVVSFLRVKLILQKHHKAVRPVELSQEETLADKVKTLKKRE